jgi:RHS repeat-associated protein
MPTHSGALTKIGYLPYGKSASTGPFGFTGQRVDVETNGLYYYRARHYSPAWGRFLQVDPAAIGTNASQPSASGADNRPNLYVYVFNDPLNRVDPTGLIVISLGVSGQAYFIFGVGVGLGVYYDTVTGQAGYYKSAEAGVGIGLSVGVTAGVSESLSTFSGLSTGYRTGAGPFSGQVNKPDIDKPISGGSASLAFGVPFDFGLTISYTKPTCLFSCK